MSDEISPWTDALNVAYERIRSLTAQLAAKDKEIARARKAALKEAILVIDKWPIPGRLPRTILDRDADMIAAIRAISTPTPTEKQG